MLVGRVEAGGVAKPREGVDRETTQTALNAMAPSRVDDGNGNSIRWNRHPNHLP